MHNYDAWAIALAVLAFASVPAALVLPWVGVFVKSPRLSFVFALVTGGAGLLALAVAQLARTVLGPRAHESDYHGILVFGLAIAVPTVGAACVLFARAFTARRRWKVIGSGFLLGLGLAVAMGCLALHQVSAANRYSGSPDPGWIFGGLLGGVPLAALGLVLLAVTSARAVQAEAAAASEGPKPQQAAPTG